MKLGEITEVGFYKEVNGEDIWECFENTDRDEEWRKDFPLLLDSWIYDYTDADDRKVYKCDGLLYKIGYDYPGLEVEKVTGTEYEVEGSMGTTLIEKKPTYKERYLELEEKYKKLEWQLKHEKAEHAVTKVEKENFMKKNKELKKWQEANKPTGICETCTEKANKEADELQKEIKELKRYKGLFENCRKLYLDVKEQAHSMCEKLEDLEDSLKRTTCQAECYKHKEADKWKALLGKVVMYCEDQDLKNDITACNIISMIEKGGI